jgi:capsular exopolysaccharide synthesis family protein
VSTSPLPPSASASDPLDDAASARQNVLRVMAVFRRRGWIPVLASTLAVAALLVYGLLKPPQYRATGMVQLGLYAPTNLDPRSPASAALFETHHRLLTSGAVVDDAMKALGYELLDGPNQVMQRQLFLSGIAITPVRDTFLLEVAASSDHPETSANIVNALMTSFIRFSEGFLTERDVLRERQLKKDEARLLANLREADAKLKQFHQESGEVSFDAERTSPLVRQQELQKRLMETTLAHAQAKTQREHLQRRVRAIAKQTEVERLAALAGDDPLVAARREAIAQINVRLASLRAHVAPERLTQLAEFRDLQAQLESERRGFRELLTATAFENVAVSVQNEAALAAQKTELEALVAQQVEEVARLNLLEGRYRTIHRDLEFAQKELEQTRAELRRQETRTVGGTGAVIVDRAQPPITAQPFVGANNLIAAAIVVFGLVLLAVLVWDHLDDAVMRPDDLAGAGVPLLGLVPHLDLDAVDELTHLRGSSWAAEALGLIRTNIAVATGGVNKGALLVTSGSPGDGKSFFSLNLATALARAGRRTLLIEADMRRPRIRPLLVLDDAPEGLSDILQGEAQLADAVRDTEFEGLDFVPSGACPLNPPDMLLRPEFERLMQRALELYDNVVVDGPPARPLADASLIARHVHGVVHVARVGTSRRSVVRAALDQIHAVGGRNVGVVLNDVSPEDDPAFRYHGYAEQAPPRGEPVPGGFFVMLPQVLDDDEDDARRSA